MAAAAEEMVVMGTFATAAGTGGGGGGGSANTAGGNGAQDTIWTQTSDSATAGPAGGGGGGGTNAGTGIGLAGGSASAGYGSGGGGGGWGDPTSGNGGAGRQGIIVINYTPTAGCHTDITLTKDAVVTGDASVIGTISKGSGTFVIDHPLDPKNRLLYHSFVESPEAKNMYDGIVTIDAYGEATIILPRYFMALNKDYVYLANAIDEPMPNLHLKRGVRREWFIGAPSFRIAGGEPGGTISWQVTGTRKDPFILKYPIIPEVWKSDNTIVPKGECIFAPLCN